MIYNEEEIVENGEKFAEWNRAVSRSNNDSYKQHAVDVLEFWLEAKIPNQGIGNLFRFDEMDEFERERHRIIELPQFAAVDRADSNGRTHAALGRYKLYLKSLQNGRVESDIAAEECEAIVENEDVNRRRQPVARRNVTAGRVINCLEGLIELIMGADNNMSEEAKFRLLARHMIQRSFFFKQESADNRHNQILDLIRRDSKIPARYSTARDVYTEIVDDRQSVVTLPKNEATVASIERTILFNSFGRWVPVLIDKDGNSAVRGIIEQVSGARVSQGRARSNITSAIISHIWGNAYNPLCFTNLWNIVVVPDYVNSILDKEETPNPTNFFDRAVNYVKAYYKELCYKLYRMDNKVHDYEQAEFDIAPLFERCVESNFVKDSDMLGLSYLEDQGFL